MSQAVPYSPRPVLPLDSLDEQTFCAALLAACHLMGSDKDLTPDDAVDDVLQVYKRLKDRQEP